uniref:Novel immune-type receptor 7b n=1 Tax=Danio rerio TaxID=7955 RepID=Q5VTP3_DANRE|nr:novel immune-type receptor 7b precursor [Danio rerio]CAH68847.1 novel immune-type receptor 7b, allele 2 [Danio rerio]
MNLSGLHPLMLFLMGIIFVKHAAFMETVYSGTNVSLLCSNILKESSYLAWFKQTDDSLPLCIVTQYVGLNPADSTYLNGFQKTRIEMSVNATFSTLRIISVDVSDSGTFYCGSFIKNHMKFHDQIQLVVVNVTNRSNIEIANTDYGTTEETSCHFFYMLTLISSGFILLPTVFAIVVLIKLKKLKKKKKEVKHSKNKKMNKQLQHKEQDEDLNYAALNLDKKSRRPVRSMRTVEPNVVYAATR